MVWVKELLKYWQTLTTHVHEIIILCRSKELGEEVIRELGDTTSNKKISIVNYHDFKSEKIIL